MFLKSVIFSLDARLEESVGIYGVSNEHSPVKFEANASKIQGSIEFETVSN